MFARLFPELHRKYLLQQTDKQALRPYLNTPLPSPRQSIFDTEFLALDFETTGLNPKQDEILSVGYTVIQQGRIRLAENGYHLIQPESDINADSVTIHGITDDHAQTGIKLSEMLNILLEKMAGRVVIAHHAEIEQGFLLQACRAVFQQTIPIRFIDTLIIEKRRYERRHQHPNPNQLRLFNLRNEYGLPRYNAHNALEDAIATAELFLAMAHTHCADLYSCKLKEFF